VSLSDGQRDALAQLRAVELVEPGALEILEVHLPQSDDWLRVDISVDCHGIEHRTGGLKLRERERLRVLIDPSFPFGPPSVFAMHGRWAGAPHVQWGISLCLYAAPTVEWNPSDGMFGFLDRLWLWLGKASAAELDPADAPLHPPVAYVSSLDEVPMVIPRADTPTVGEVPWIGGVEIAKISESRLDLIGWHESVTSWLEGAAPAILLPSTLDFEYPSTIAALLDALSVRGVPRERALTILKLAALGLEEDQPLVVVIGTAMRGTAADRRQHLAAWYVEPLFAWGLAHSLKTNAADPALRDSAERMETIMTEWAASAKIHWCPVREDRPEVTRRRDTDSPIESFAGKTVAIWGCEALGAPIATWIARAGVAKLILYDKAPVTPGVLVRQPFTDEDIGENKARVLAQRLKRIRPRDLDLEVHARNVLQSSLERDDWHDGAEIVIDATASSVVSVKLERTRRINPQPAAIVSVILGHTAQHVLAVLAPPGYSGAGADVMRQVKLACGRKPAMREFLQEFWPDPPRVSIFQPEPGCSDPTFTGSGAEVAALAAHALTRIAGELTASDDRSAVAHLATLDTKSSGPCEARLTFPAAQRVAEAITDFEVRISSTAAIGLKASIAGAEREVGQRSETGGLLFGERDAAAGVIWVDEIIGPPPDSRRSPEEFVCGTEGVARYEHEKLRRGQGSLQYLGMWHTHPTQDPIVSNRDVRGITRLLDAASSPISHGLLLILGHTLPGPAVLGAFVFQRSEIENPNVSHISFAEPAALVNPARANGEVGIALSGGGSRAIAFHLGCLRALYERGILQRARVISSVSGGSLISALWAYSDEGFDAFEERVTSLLAAGLQRRIAQRMLLSMHAPQVAASRALATATALRLATAPSRLRGYRDAPPPLRRRRVSRTDVLADVLERDVVGARRLDAPRRGGLDVVINACELSTGSAFRFGSRESGCWRTGRLAANDASLATAVAASAAYPLALPALDREWTFKRRDGSLQSERIALSDGGLYDNLGTSCLEPDRSPDHGFNLYKIDYIIACDAGRGLLDPVFPRSWLPRVQRSFEASFRKLQDGGRGRLHALTEAGRLTGFAMPYLGQQDRALPAAPADLVPRSSVAGYPTNFRAMNAETIVLLSRRGEQLTNALLDTYIPEL
jgi:predicted acylesterase/phospholipase RssA